MARGLTKRLATALHAYPGNMPAALIWLLAALGLVGAEALTGDMFLLMLGGGALAAAGSSWLFDWPVWADGLVFLVVSVLLLVRGAAGVETSVAVRQGTRTRASRHWKASMRLVLDRVTEHQGQVKLEGEVWTARPLNDYEVYEPGDQVTVMHIDGATAVVWKN